MKVFAFFSSIVAVVALKFNDVDVTRQPAGDLRVNRKSSMLQLPHDEGMMHNNWGSDYMDDEGQVNLHAVMDTEDEPDTNTYPGEDEERERANDEVLRFKNGHRKPKIYRPANQAIYSNDDLWK